MNMIRKGQVKGVEKGDISAQVRFVAQIFAVVIQLVLIYTELLTGISFCNTTPWHDLPSRFGVIHTRFSRWSKTGVWEQVFQHLADDADNEYTATRKRTPQPHLNLQETPTKLSTVWWWEEWRANCETSPELFCALAQTVMGTVEQLANTL